LIHRTLALSVLAHLGLAAVLVRSPGVAPAAELAVRPELLEEIALEPPPPPMDMAEGPVPAPVAPAPAVLAAPDAPGPMATTADGYPAIPTGAGDPLDRVLAKLGPAAYGTGDADGAGAGRGRDRSSPARLGGPVRWPWPHEADSLPIDHASVSLIVDVTAEGRATAVHVLDDPDGFGQAAWRCAMAHTYIAKRDRGGRAVAGTTLPFRVRFDRLNVGSSLASAGQSE
jgi:hypothetical protein